MKKKKFLLGLTIAAAAALSLAACGGKDNKKDDESSVVSSATSEVVSTSEATSTKSEASSTSEVKSEASSTSTKSEASSTSTKSEASSTSTKSEATSEATKSEATTTKSEASSTSTAPVESSSSSVPTTVDNNVQVTLYFIDKDSNTIQAASKVVVDKNATLASKLNDLEGIDGYTFVGAYQDEFMFDEYVGTETFADVTEIYLVYDRVTKFGTVSAMTGNVLSDDFDKYAATDSLTTFSGTYGTKGIYQATKNGKTGYYVSLGAGAAVQVDAGNDDHVETVVDFGTDATSGKVYAYFELTPENSAAGWTFGQFMSKGVDSKGEIGDVETFGFRNDGGVIKYRLNAGSKYVAGKTNPTFTAKTTFYMVFDLSAGTVSVEINDEAWLENEYVGVTNLEGFKFVSSDTGSKQVKLDNLAVSLEAAELAAHKTGRKSYASKLIEANYTADYTMNAAAIATLKSTYEAAVDAAADVAAVDTALDTLKTELAKVNNDKQQALANAKADATSTIEAFVNDAGYAAHKDAVDEVITTYKQKVADATTVEAVATELANAQNALTLATSQTVNVTFKFVLADKTSAGEDVIREIVQGTATKLDATLANYNVLGYYTDADLTTEANAETTYAEDGVVYVKVEAKSEYNLTFALKDEAWETNGTYYPTSAGKTIEDNNKVSHDCLQLALDTSKNKDQQLKTPTFQSGATSATLNIKGWTNGGSAASQYVTITAYDANDVAVGTVTAYTSAGKVIGSFSTDADGKVTDIVVSVDADHAGSNISYIKLSCNTTTKSYMITELSVSYAI